MLLIAFAYHASKSSASPGLWATVDVLFAPPEIGLPVCPSEIAKQRLQVLYVLYLGLRVDGEMRDPFMLACFLMRHASVLLRPSLMRVQ